MDVWQVDELLSQERVDVNGVCYDIHTSAALELTALTERILNFVNSTLRGKSIRTVILGGGGAPLVYPYLDEAARTNWQIAANPRRGNVEGAYAFLERRERSQP